MPVESSGTGGTERRRVVRLSTRPSRLPTPVRPVRPDDAAAEKSTREQALSAQSASKTPYVSSKPDLGTYGEVEVPQPQCSCLPRKVECGPGLREEETASL